MSDNPKPKTKKNNKDELKNELKNELQRICEFFDNSDKIVSSCVQKYLPETSTSNIQVTGIWEVYEQSQYNHPNKSQ